MNTAIVAAPVRFAKLLRRVGRMALVVHCSSIVSVVRHPEPNSRSSAMPPAGAVVVRPTADQRNGLAEVVHTGACSARASRRARVLPEADADGPDARTDERIAQAPDAARTAVMRVRQQFAAEGLDAPR